MSRFGVALLAAVVLAAVPRPPPPRSARSARPTGKLGCMFYSDPDDPAARCAASGGAATTARWCSTRRRKGKRIKITDTVLDPKAKVLALRANARSSGA